jgi:hypothetical protein
MPKGSVTTLQQIAEIFSARVEYGESAWRVSQRVEIGVVEKRPFAIAADFDV